MPRLQRVCPDAKSGRQFSVQVMVEDTEFRTSNYERRFWLHVLAVAQGAVASQSNYRVRGSGLGEAQEADALHEASRKKIVSHA